MRLRGEDFAGSRASGITQGTYWSSTVDGHVIYESLLELARSLFAGFDARVRHIAAQPFLLRTSVDRKPCKHIPDYLVITDTGPVVVDVKPARRLADPKVASTFEWTPATSMKAFTCELMPSLSSSWRGRSVETPSLVAGVRPVRAWSRGLTQPWGRQRSWTSVGGWSGRPSSRGRGG